MAAPLKISSLPLGLLAVACLAPREGESLCFSTPGAGPLAVGDSIHVRAGYFAFDGSSCRYGKAAGIRFESSDSTIVSVSEQGMVVGRHLGSARVAVVLGGQQREEKITVVPPVARIVVSPDSTTMAVGDTTRFHARLIGPDGREVKGVELSWWEGEDGRLNGHFNQLQLIRASFKVKGSFLVQATDTGRARVFATMRNRFDSALVRVVPRSDRLRPNER